MHSCIDLKETKATRLGEGSWIVEGILDSERVFAFVPMRGRVRDSCSRKLVQRKNLFANVEHPYQYDWCNPRKNYRCESHNRR